MDAAESIARRPAGAFAVVETATEFCERAAGVVDVMDLDGSQAGAREQER